MSREEEILNITQEECAELIQMISKVRRFGLDETHIKAGVSNRQRLTEEAGDVLCMIDLMIDYGIIDIDEVDLAIEKKLEKLRQWSTIFVEEINDETQGI